MPEVGCTQIVEHRLGVRLDAPERCGAPAVGEFLWPGQTDWCIVCEPHAAWAKKVASTLGFVLQYRERYAPEARRSIDLREGQ